MARQWCPPHSIPNATPLHLPPTSRACAKSLTARPSEASCTSQSPPVLTYIHSVLFLSLQSQPPLFCDNQAAIKLATDDNYHARKKHIDIRFHFIRQVITSGAIDMVYCPTDDMTADILTKALPRWKVMCHSLGLGLHQPSGGVAESGVEQE